MRYPLYIPPLFFVNAFLILFSIFLNLFTTDESFNPLYNYLNKYCEFEGEVYSFPVNKKDKITFYLKIHSIDKKQFKNVYLLINVSKEIKIKKTDRFLGYEKILLPPPPRNIGEFDFRKYLYNRNVYGVVNIYNEDFFDILPTQNKFSFLWNLIILIREKMQTLFSKYLSPQERAVLQGILLGEKPTGFPEIENNFRKAGVIHILVASGSNVGFVMLFVILICRIIAIPKRFSIIISIPAIFFYSALCGNDPPVMRATIMFATASIAYILAREQKILNAILISAFVAMLSKPKSIFDPSFQMSYIATCGIVFLVPLLKSNYFKNKLWGWLEILFLTSFCAQTILAPVLAHYFNQISIIGIIANLIVVPLSAVGFLLGFIWNIVSVFSLNLEKIFEVITSFCIKILISIVNFFSSFAFSSKYVVAPAYLFIGFFYISVIFLIFVKSKRQRIYIFLFLIFSNIFIVLYPNKKTNPKIIIPDYYSGSMSILIEDRDICLILENGNMNRNLERIILTSGYKNIEKIINFLNSKIPESFIRNFKVKEVILPTGDLIHFKSFSIRAFLNNRKIINYDVLFNKSKIYSVVFEPDNLKNNSFKIVKINSKRYNNIFEKMRWQYAIIQDTKNFDSSRIFSTLEDGQIDIYLSQSKGKIKKITKWRNQ